MTNLTNQADVEQDLVMAKAAGSSTYNLYEAKSGLSRLVDEAAAGKEIIIAKAGKPLAKLVPFAPKGKKKLRDWDAGKELFQVTYMAPDWDKPAWSDEELDEFGFL